MNKTFDLFDMLSHRFCAFNYICILNYIGIKNIIKNYINYYGRNDNIFFNYPNNVPTFNSITFKSKINTFIYSLPFELTRSFNGYYSTNIYDRILKFENFMNHFFVRSSSHVLRNSHFDLFDYIDLDTIIEQLNNNFEDENEFGNEKEYNFYPSREADNLYNNDKSKNEDNEKNNNAIKDNKFKYCKVYNLESINNIIETIVEIFQLNGHNKTDYDLNSMRLNHLTRTDFMVLFNYNFIVDVDY